MHLCIDHGVIVDTNDSYSSSINEKEKRPHQYINNVVRIQLLSFVHIFYKIPFIDIFIWGFKIYIINSNQGGKLLCPCTNTYPCVCPPVIDPSRIPQIADVFFVEYYNSTKVVIYFDPNTHRIKKTFHIFIDEYYIKVHSK